MLEQVRELVNSGALGEAEARLSAIGPEQQDAEAAVLLGIIYTKTGRFDAAAGLLEQAARNDATRIEAQTWLAAVRRAQGRLDEAVAALEQVLQIREDDPEVFNLLGVCLLSLGRSEEAEQAFRSSLLLAPDAAPGHANLGMALRLQNRGDEALESFRRAVQRDPGQAQNHLQVFKQLQQLSRWDEAIAILEAARLLHPGSVLLAEALATAYGRIGRAADAEQLFRAIAPHNANAANSFAQWLQDVGRFDDSVDVLNGSLMLKPVQGLPYRLLAEARVFELDGRPILESALQVAQAPAQDEVSQMHISYALGKMYERDRNYEAAMSAYDTANAIAYQTYPACKSFDPAWTGREPEALAELYSAGFLQSLAQHGSPDARPIFIVGMVRSGTTLLDQIISSHPGVISTGEGTFWNTGADGINQRWFDCEPGADEVRDLADRFLAATGIGPNVARFTDKMPLNYRHLGLIRTVFPNARILHIRRDPFDTCLSIYTTFFGGGPTFAYKKENIAAFYRAYLRTMDHWRGALPAGTMLELDYEELVTEPEPAIRKVLEFLRLPWDDACLSHESNTELVSTPSRWQARQPIYTGSVGKRARFGAYAEEFLAIP